MLPLALFGIVLLGLSLAAGSKAAPAGKPGTVPPLPGSPPVDQATAAAAVTSAIVSASPVQIPDGVQQAIAQALASKNVAQMVAVANSLAQQYPFAADQLRAAADALAKSAMTGAPPVPPPAITPSPGAPGQVTTQPVPSGGLTPTLDADIRGRIYQATDPAALDTLASLLSGQGPTYAALVQLAQARASELRAMLATGTAVQAVQNVLNSSAPAVTAASKPLIMQGSTGEAVKTWQRIVGVNPDGIFGSGTVAATKKWQTAHGIYADGKVGPNTWAAAAKTEAAAAPPMTAPTVTVAPMPSITAPPSAPSVPLTDLQVKTAATAQYIKGAKRGSEDKMMIKNWQTQAGVPSPDGLFGAGSAERMAELGVSDLPMVWYWPKVNATARVATYKSRLNEMANQAQASGNLSRATQLRASAARDNGQGRQIGE